MKDKSSDKKLVQARLPFKSLSPLSTGVDKSSLAKKRKLSSAGQEEEIHKKKIVKENIINNVDTIVINDENDIGELTNANYNPVVRLVDNVDELVQDATDHQSKNIKSDDSDSNNYKNDSVICVDEISGESDRFSKDESFSDGASQKLDSSLVIEGDVKSNESINSEQHNVTVTTPSQTKKTSKQLQRQQESAKKKEEKEKARLEREKLKLEEKEQRLKQKLEKDEQKKKERAQKEEQRRKEKEEKEKQKQIEKEEREKRRLSEIELKNEERRLKEEDKRKKEELKEEERKKKELEKEEADQKQKKAAAAFVNFFQRKVIEDAVEIFKKPEDKITEKEQNNFMPFCLKADMKLAPINRHVINDESKAKLDAIINTSIIKANLYVNEIKNPNYKKGKSLKTWDTCENDVVIIEDGEAIVETDLPKQQHSKPKLFQFHENRRPPYWGTWTKSSECVKPRAPFGKDKILDYEIDSDSEWEEEEPGESLHGSDDEKEKDESDDEYEVDNDFFVPHGYLSEEEQNVAEELSDGNSAEDMKVKLKLLQNEFNEEMKKKTEKIKPRLYGCIWSNADGSKPDKCVETIWNMLNQYSMIYESPLVLKPEDDTFGVENDTHTGPGSKLTKFPDTLLPELIKLIHGNEYSRLFLIKEFYTYVNKKNEKQDISKSSIGRKIHEIAKYTTVQDKSGVSRRCWFVQQKYREECGLTDWPLINTWSYSLKHRKLDKSSCEGSPLVTKKKTDKTNTNISKFTKVLDSDDIARQFNQPVDSKKRVALISVPSGSKFAKKSDENEDCKVDEKVKIDEKQQKVKSRVNLLTNFINRAEIKYAKEEKAEYVSSTIEKDVDDCIMLSD